jgi:hypothetical protein
LILAVKSAIWFQHAATAWKARVPGGIFRFAVGQQHRVTQTVLLLCRCRWVEETWEVSNRVEANEASRGLWMGKHWKALHLSQCFTPLGASKFEKSCYGTPSPGISCVFKRLSASKRLWLFDVKK